MMDYVRLLQTQGTSIDPDRVTGRVWATVYDLAHGLYRVQDLGPNKVVDSGRASIARLIVGQLRPNREGLVLDQVAWVKWGEEKGKAMGTTVAKDDTDLQGTKIVLTAGQTKKALAPANVRVNVAQGRLYQIVFSLRLEQNEGNATTGNTDNEIHEMGLFTHRLQDPNNVESHTLFARKAFSTVYKNPGVAIEFEWVLDLEEAE